jgi:hypothetical protein
MWEIIYAVAILRSPHKPHVLRDACATYSSGAKYWITLIIAPADISVLNDVFAWFIVPLIGVRRF